MKTIIGTKTLSKNTWQQAVNALKAANNSKRSTRKLYNIYNGKLLDFETALNFKIRAGETTAKDHSAELLELSNDKKRSKKTMLDSEQHFDALMFRASMSVIKAAKVI